MISLDTNVISAVMRQDLDPRPIDWLNHQRLDSIWTTTISIFEVRFGIELLPLGKRRQAFEHAFALAIDSELEGRVLTFDDAAADAAARIAARLRTQGRTSEIRDAQIAGIAAAHNATLATRNTRHFEGAGIALIDPWS